MLKMDSGGNSIRLAPITHPDEAPAIPGTMRQCPLCHELMPEEDWMRLPRHETAGTLGKTIKLTCPECHRQSSSIQWRERRRRQEVIM